MQFRSLLISFLLGFTLWGNAQTYELSITNEPYNDLVGSTSLNGNITWDDPQFNIPIGFDFNYFTKTLNEIVISEWGSGGTLTEPTNGAENSSLFVPYGADLIDRGYDFMIDEPSVGSLSSISYLTEGSEGNRILKIEWNNVGFYDDLETNLVSSYFTNFQLWLYEGSNQIEIRFGENFIDDLEVTFEGETGTLIGLFEDIDFDTEELTGEAYTLSGPPESASLTAITNVDSDLTFLNGVIPPGTVYRLTKSIETSTSDELAENLSLSTFPNPVSNQLEIRMNNSEHQINTISIVNLTGQIIKKMDSNNQTSIDFSALNSGIYLLEISTSAGVINQKIIKE